MADSLLDNYNPLYDIHLRQYFALPHMQKHLQKMGLLESTLNLNGDEVYARHHAMMDMMLKNREAQLLKMAELRKKLDAAEKVEICRRIRTGQSPESYQRGKPSRSLSRNRAALKGGSGGRQRRFSNSFEDRDFVQHIEERNADPDDYDTRDPYKRLSANAKRFNYLHKLDDNTLIAYKDNLRKQLQRLERFREISFGPHSVARQPPPPQASWFFRRRSILNMRGRKAATGNKLNASHDNRTSCPPTTRKRKDSNTRLPPIHPNKNRVPTKPPAPVSLQQITTKLPPAAKKPAPNRGRPSNKRQTTTTTTTTITSVSKSPTTTLPILPSVTGHGIFTGAAAAATVAAIGTAVVNRDSVISDEPARGPSPSPPTSPHLETQKTFDRTSPVDNVYNDELPADLLEHLADESEKVSEKDEEQFNDHIDRQIVLENVPANHGDYENSDSEPEYAEEDRETPEKEFTVQSVQQTASTPSPTEPLAVNVHSEKTDVSPPISTASAVTFSPENPHEAHHDLSSEQINSSPSPIQLEKEDINDSPAHSPTLPSQVVLSQIPTHSPDYLERRFSPTSIESSEASEQPVNRVRSPALSVHSPSAEIGSRMEDMEDQAPTLQSPVTENNLYGQQEQDSIRSDHGNSAPQSPDASEHSHQELEVSAQSVHSEHNASPQSPVASLTGSQLSEHPAEAAQQSPVLSVHSHHAVEHFEQHEAVPQSPVLSVHGSHILESRADEAPHSPIHSVHSSEHLEKLQDDVISHSPVGSVHNPLHPLESEDNVNTTIVSEHHEDLSSPQSQSSSVHTSFVAEDEATRHSPVKPANVSEHVEHDEPVPQSPVVSEKNLVTENFQSVHSEQEFSPQSPALSIHDPEPFVKEQSVPQSPAVSVHSSHVSEVEIGLPESEVVSDKDAIVANFSSTHSDDESEAMKNRSPSPPSAKHSEQDIETESSHLDNQEELTQVQQTMQTSQDRESPMISTTTEYFAPPIPHSPSNHTSDASENEHDDENLQEEIASVSPPVAHSPTSADLYNPANGNMESPIPFDTEHEPVVVPGSPDVVPASPGLVVEEKEEIAGIPIADRIDLEAYHNSPTKESTSPVATNIPVKISVTPEQVVEQLNKPEQVAEAHGSFEDMINQSADVEASHLIQEALTEAPAIIEMVQTYEDRFSPQASPLQETEIYNSEIDHSSAALPETYELQDDSLENTNAMMTSIYQPTSDHEGSQTSLTEKEPETNIKLNEWDDGDKHVKETTTRSEFTEGDTHHSFSETVTVITENGNKEESLVSPQTAEISPNDGAADNISTDSLIIHDDHDQSDYHQMTQSVYQPKEEVEEKEWDEGNKHVHEVISNVEHTDESGKHFTETVTTTTTVIKSGDDLKNNNDENGDHSDDQDESSILEEDEHGHSSNGNAIRETITTTHTVTSGGLPEGGILVDDGDEKNISSI